MDAHNPIHRVIIPRKFTAKVQKLILQDCIEGRNGRHTADHWLPKWLRFGVQETEGVEAQAPAQAPVIEQLVTERDEAIDADAENGNDEMDTADAVPERLAA